MISVIAEGKIDPSCLPTMATQMMIFPSYWGQPWPDRAISSTPLPAVHRCNDVISKDLAVILFLGRGNVTFLNGPLPFQYYNENDNMRSAIYPFLPSPATKAFTKRGPLPSTLTLADQATVYCYYFIG